MTDNHPYRQLTDPQEISEYIINETTPISNSLLQNVLNSNLNDVQRIAVLKLVQMQIDIMIEIINKRIENPEEKLAAKTLMGIEI